MQWTTPDVNITDEIIAHEHVLLGLPPHSRFINPIEKLLKDYKKNNMKRSQLRMKNNSIQTFEDLTHEFAKIKSFFEM